MKKRITITESDRERILSLHTKYKNALINEQTATPQTTPAQPAATQPSVTERFKTAVCPGKDTKKGQICKDQALKVQIKINDKCPSDKLPVKLLEDGVWGPKSTAAFTACGGSISGGTTAQTTTPQTPSVQSPIGAQDSTSSNTTASSGSSESIDSLSV
jgi:hypothetical protein